MMKTFHSFSSEKTKAFGAEIAKSLIANRQSLSGALVIALRGDLGAGKTTFTQGFFRGLGIKRNPMSPTFVIMRRYKVESRKSKVKSRFTDIYHFDAYRLKKAEDMAVLEFGSILSNPRNIVIVEWPERMKKSFAPRCRMVESSNMGKRERTRYTSW